jgi:hypothetical protein
MNSSFAALMAIALTALLGACAQHETSSTSTKPRTMESRLLRPDMKKGNPFDKEFNTASAGDRGGMKSLGRKGYKTDDVAGLKAFGGGTRSFHTKDFSQAGKSSRYLSQESHFSSQKSTFGDKTFATKKSQFDGDAAHEGSQTYQGGDDVFKTGDFGPATKSLKANKRVVFDTFTSGDKPKTANSYSEDDVKRMLGR